MNDIRSTAATQTNFERTCWRCGATYMCRYKNRRKCARGWFNDLCKECNVIRKLHNKSPLRKLTAMELQWVEVNYIHFNLLGPSWTASSLVTTLPNAVPYVVRS